MTHEPNHIALSPRAALVHEKRNAAFRVLYDTVLEIEDAGEDQIFSILCKNLKRLTKARRAALAVIDDECQCAKLKVYLPDETSVTLWSDRGPSVPLADEWAESMHSYPIHACDQFAARFSDTVPVLNCEQEGSCYRLSCIRDHHLIAVGFVQLEPEARLELKDLIDIYMNLVGTILQRLNAEREVRDSEDYLKTILESVNSGIMVIDPDSHQILDVNRYACSMFKLSREKIIGQKCFDLFCPEKRDNCPMQQVAIDGLTTEHTFKFEGGRTCSVIKNVKPVTRKGRRYYLETFVDITDIKEAQQAGVRLMKNLQEANDELTSFAHIVSHDLKAPLRGIISLANWLQDDYRDVLDESGQELLDLMQTRTEKMVGLIDGILQYSRVGMTQGEPTHVDLNKIVPELIDFLDPPHHIIISIDDALPVLMAESVLVEQLFQNLVSNAIKYSDKEQGRIHITCVDQGKCWQFGVADNGPGIAPEFHDCIFRIFNTADRDENSESTGVGLSIVKRIVEVYGGTIWVESQPGEGTTFYFDLPKAMCTVGV